MVRVLLPLWLAVAQQSGSAGQPAGTPPRTQPAEAIPPPGDQLGSEATPPISNKMQPALEKQRASVRKQAGNWISIGEAGPNESFLIPFPKPPEAVASNISYLAPCEPMGEGELDRIVRASAARQNVSVPLIRALIFQESGGRPCAVSTKGAEGLMQLMPEVQREMSVSNPFDPGQSVEGGVRLLRQLLDRYAGDIPRALAAYNAGAGAVDRAGGIPPIAETTNYVKQIVKRLQIE
jgi:soluble lytic murein transglycosylase-like protein